jgi:hypothetical protein
MAGKDLVHGLAILEALDNMSSWICDTKCSACLFGVEAPAFGGGNLCQGLHGLAAFLEEEMRK